MLQLLRKYQKAIFIVVTVTVVLTFSFFGTQGAANSGVTVEKDYKIGKSVDGSFMYHKEIQDLSFFLKTDALDAPIVEGRVYVNLLNDGVLKKDIFETGIGTMLLEHYYPRFEKELKERSQRFAAYRPYANGQNPYLSLESLWKQFKPSLLEDYKKFQSLPLEKDGMLNKEKIDSLVSLYMGQCAFPPSSSRRLLSYLQQQYRHIAAIDPYVQSGDLALFYAKTAEDWFGGEFIDTLAHFIHHASVYAKTQGYKVSKEEAKASLMKIALENFKMISGEEGLKQDDFVKYFQRSLQMLQMDEKSAVAVWQKVLLARRMFSDVGHNVFIDKTLYEQFHQFASRSVYLDLYSMQPSLELKGDEDLEKFEIYTKSIAKGKTDPLGVPSVFASAEEVMKKAPELVQKRFLVEVAAINRSDVESKISLRELMNWQLEGENYVKLEKIFTKLSGVKEIEARYEKIESLGASERSELDRHSLRMIVEERFDLLQKALDAKNRQVKEIAVNLKGSYSPLEGIKDSAKLLKRLESDEEIDLYSQDSEHFYSIKVLEKSPLEVVTFDEANKRKLLDEMLSQESDFALSSEIENVKKAVARLGVSFTGKSDDEVKSLCAKYRFYHHLISEQHRLMEGQELESQVQVDGEEKGLSKRAPLNKQFVLERRNEECLQKQKSSLIGHEVFDMQEGEWSNIVLREYANPFFFQVREKIVDENAMQKNMVQGQEILANEAKRCLMAKLLVSIDSLESVES
ncbi:MAG: hypothetical protein FJZ56_05595 [Chlamydiae bacterium]|nr:hypothetical protein [Chlamydiota bacterium]